MRIHGSKARGGTQPASCWHTASVTCMHTQAHAHTQHHAHSVSPFSFMDRETRTGSLKADGTHAGILSRTPRVLEDRTQKHPGKPAEPSRLPHRAVPVTGLLAGRPALTRPRERWPFPEPLAGCVLSLYCQPTPGTYVTLLSELPSEHGARSLQYSQWS